MQYATNFGRKRLLNLRSEMYVCAVNYALDSYGVKFLPTLAITSFVF